MKEKKYKAITLCIICCTFILLMNSCIKEIKENTQRGKFNDDIFQYSSKQAFIERKLDGSISYEELKKLGNFGLGTFNGLNGEMVALDGKFYRVPFSGVPEEAQDSNLAPYCVLKFFNSDFKTNISDTLTFDQIEQIILASVNDTTKPFAIKVNGKYSFAKTRSVKKQNKPYPSLEEVISNQIIFDLTSVEGTAVGFWFPKYFDGVNFPGFHFHFITNDKKAGGHLLDCEIAAGDIDIDYGNNLIIKL